MSDPLSAWWVHAASVRRLSGAGAGGDVYEAPATVTGFWNDGTKLVLDAAGQEVVSSAQFAFPASEAAIPVGSVITPPAPFRALPRKVIASAIGDAGDQPVPTHQEVALL